jgi:LmbE family N-acetylglucosaminyl deacetylase
MLNLHLGLDSQRLRVLCLGAHSDDIEIGCGGTLLRWLSEFAQLELTWVVMSAAGERGNEARRSAQALTQGAAQLDLVLGDFEDAHLPADYARAKAFLRSVKERSNPDVVLTHHRQDAHQDHRLVAELTWQTWRDHLILEYEIPKYEGDLGRPNLYVALSDAIGQRKIEHLLAHFGSQRSKGWFSQATFRSLMHLRGIECRAPEGAAEAFHVGKAVL